MKGYKVFDYNWCCQDMQYTCPGIFEYSNKIILCQQGFHYSFNLIDCFRYKSGLKNKIKIAEIKDLNFHDIVEEKVYFNNEFIYPPKVFTIKQNKWVTDKIEIIREISWDEAYDIIFKELPKHLQEFSQILKIGEKVKYYNDLAVFTIMLRQYKQKLLNVSYIDWRC